MTDRNSKLADTYLELQRTKLSGGRLAQKHLIQIFTPDNNIIFKSETDGPNFTRKCEFTDSDGKTAWTLEPNRSMMPSKYTLKDPHGNVIANFKTGIFRSTVYRPKVSVTDAGDRKLFTLQPGKLSSSGKLTTFGKYLSSDIVVKCGDDIVGFTGSEDNKSIMDKFKRRLLKNIRQRLNYSINRIADIRLAAAVMVIHRLVIEDLTGTD